MVVCIVDNLDLRNRMKKLVLGALALALAGCANATLFEVAEQSQHEWVVLEAQEFADYFGYTVPPDYSEVVMAMAATVPGSFGTPSVAMVSCMDWYSR